jgi:hypothetical protein
MGRSLVLFGPCDLIVIGLVHPDGAASLLLVRLRDEVELGTRKRL